MWPNNTRLKNLQLSTIATSAANPMSWDFPKTGILAGIHLVINDSISGTVTGPNALGIASMLKRVRLTANAGLNIIDLSGAGYHYLYRDMIDVGFDPLGYANARAAVSVTTGQLDVYIPLSINARDPIGLIMLQNEQTQLNLQVEMESAAVVATGVPTISLTVTPVLEVFSVPVDTKDWPSLQYLHTITEESLTVSGAGDVTYYWPRGNVYSRIVHGAGIAQSPADAWSRAKVRVNGGDFIFDYTPAYLNGLFYRSRGRARLLGVIPIDLMGLSGLGNYGSARDLFDSSLVTDVATVITATGATTLYTIKDQLVNLMPSGTPGK